ncbi:hypothetical protein [Legionella oakridgensis]|uniref:Uncharacterized protein n=2 Tax=Legionella oakridgensis TaxID=29423 RepID=W0BAF7_9GAMM|nr:hypothetical protein [Legionella oakridgensis]AHE65607.1 hypothetical protein Loa_00016 [Legionella oakridgensis ATCC 33761 = DSM 21215]ETO94546.1 hypothetical protein LOR_10c01120 [Legionella oakridgensis RV-2-2007]KTD38299.1 hypothetical protein Loak_1975 [Legionella oakridgensis]STY15569.1 Uncharacterised protein [Legionella longbeachae]
MQEKLEALLRGPLTSEELTENRLLLDALPSREKIDIATQMVLSVASESLRAFNYDVEALRHPEKNEETFHETISQALEVRQRLESILDLRNRHPHRQLLAPEFNVDLYIKFSFLCISLIAEQAEKLAARLAETTPFEHKSELARNINLAFGERSPLALAINEAMLARTSSPTRTRQAIFSNSTVAAEQQPPSFSEASQFRA